MILKLSNPQTMETFGIEREVYYFVLSDYPRISAVELKNAVAFIRYEKSFNRKTEIMCEDKETLAVVIVSSLILITVINFMNEKKKKNKSSLSAYYKAAKPALRYKWCYIVLTLIGIVIVFADLAFAQANRILFDSAPNITQGTAARIILSFVIIIIIQYIFGFADTYVFSYFNESVIYTMRREILGKLQRLEMEFYDSNHTSKITNTFFNQMEIVKDFVVEDVRNMIKLPLTLPPARENPAFFISEQKSEKLLIISVSLIRR